MNEWAVFEGWNGYSDPAPRTDNADFKVDPHTVVVKKQHVVGPILKAAPKDTTVLGPRKARAIEL
jgi:hypothetical protein